MDPWVEKLKEAASDVYVAWYRQESQDRPMDKLMLALKDIGVDVSAIIRK